MDDPSTSTVRLASDRPVIRDGFIVPVNGPTSRAVTCTHVTDVAAVTVLASAQRGGGWLVQLTRKSEPGHAVLLAIYSQHADAERIAGELMDAVAAWHQRTLHARLAKLERDVLAMGDTHAEFLERAL